MNSQSIERLVALNLPEGFVRRLIDRIPVETGNIGKTICKAASDYAASNEPDTDGIAHYIAERRDLVGTILGLNLEGVASALASNEAEAESARELIANYMAD